MNCYLLALALLVALFEGSQCAASSSSWPVWQGDSHHSGRSVHSAPTALGRWKNETLNRWIGSNFVEMNGILFVGSPDYYFQRYAVAGYSPDNDKEHWRIRLEKGWIAGQPAANTGKGLVYVTANYGISNHQCFSKILAINAQGEIEYSQQNIFEGGTALGKPGITSEGEVVVVSRPCVDLFSSKIRVTLWLLSPDLKTVKIKHTFQHSKIVEEMDEVPFVLSSDFPVVFVCLPYSMHAINIMTGILIWSWSVPADNLVMISHPSLDDSESTVYVTCHNVGTSETRNELHVMAIASSTGRLKWNTTLLYNSATQHQNAVTPAVDEDGNLIVAVQNFIVSLSSGKGKIVWKHSVDPKQQFLHYSMTENSAAFPSSSSLAMPIIASNGVVLWGGFGHHPLHNGGLIALNVTSGDVIWEIWDKNSNFFWSLPYLDAKGQLWVWQAGRMLHQRVLLFLPS